MDIRFQNLGPDQWKGAVMLALCCEGESLPGQPELDKAAPWLAVAPALRDFNGRKDELAILHGHPELAIPRVLAIGLGPREKLDNNGLRKAVAAAVQRCRSLGLESILLPEPCLARLPGGRERLVEECVYAAQMALYNFTALKKPVEGEPPAPLWLALGFDGESVPDAAHAAARRGERSARAVALARDLANMPGNLLYPERLAERAAELAKEGGFSCSVLDAEALAREDMNAMLAVGQGSVRPPRLIVLEYAPAGHEQEKPLIFVGKGITFDSGGVSLKPSSNMHQMKSDMSGAAAVLAAITAFAEEETPRRIVGLLACAENMPDGGAARPGDVVRAANGDTVEIINTDAEGRLVLCDALVYAQKMWMPSAIIDVATLTGACMVALGTGLAGLFTDDDTLAERILASGGMAGEHYWRLPLWPDYAEHLKSDIADICHTGPREGGAINAALFLKHFVRDGVRWAHLDIAGVDWNAKKTPLCPVGAAGFAARTLLELGRGGVQ